MTKKFKTKCFVLDTNVILHDSSCLSQFDEHDVVIPITVLEELDNFKKGNDTLNFHAREFARSLDAIIQDRLFDGGVSMGEGRGKLSIRLDRGEYHKDMALNFSGSKPDHRILNAAYTLKFERCTTSVILVTKDVNLRMKAKSVGVLAEDYTSDRVSDLEQIQTGIHCVEDCDPELIDELFENNCASITAEQLGGMTPVANECYILRNNKKSALASYDKNLGELRRVEKKGAFGVNPRNAEQSFSIDMLLNDDIKLVAITGKAGTGKTLMVIAAALELKAKYHQIYVARPIIPLSNKDIGFLPGDIDAKIGPYMQPLYDNLGVIKNQFPENDRRAKVIKDMLEQEKLKITPLAFIRGRSLVKIFFIVDEAQNLTPNEIKTIITRAGEGTKLIFTGDINQIDHPWLDSYSNGLSYLISKMHDQPLFAHITLQKGERSELAELAADLL